MSLTLLLKLVSLVIAGIATVGFVFYMAVLSPNDWIYQGRHAPNWRDGGVHGAPGPVAGAGLPVAVVGLGVYWLIRRRRKS